MESKFDLDDELKEYLDSKGDVSKFINKCIREAKEKEENSDSKCDNEPIVDNTPIQSTTNNGAIPKLVYYIMFIFILFVLIISLAKSCGSSQTNLSDVDTSSVQNAVKPIQTAIHKRKINTDSIIRVMHKNFTFKKDEFKNGNFLWVMPNSSSKFRSQNRVYAYFALEKGHASNLRIVIQYTSDDWLFIQSCDFNVDGHVYNFTPTKMETDNGIVGDESMIWEWCDDEIGYSDYSTFKAIGNANKVKMKLNGSQYYDARNLTKKEIYYIGQTLKYYKKLGGVVNE